MKIVKWLLIACGLFVVALAFFISVPPAVKKVPGSQPANKDEEAETKTEPEKIL